MIKRELIQSDANPYVFYKKEIAVLSYVDDSLIFTEQKLTIDELFLSLSKKCLFTNEGEAGGFIGVETLKNEDGFTLKQLQVIKTEIELLGQNDANPNDGLVVQPFLNKNKDGKPRHSDSFH